MLLVALIGFVLLSAARPGWAASLRRRGSLGDAFLRASIAAAGLLGLLRWVHLLSKRSAAVYEPDPNLPSSLPFPVPAVDVLWTAARGTFVLAVLGAVAAMALRSDFFRAPLGRALGALAILVALAPASLRSPGLAAADFMATVLFIALDRGVGRAPPPRARSGVGPLRHLHRRRAGGHRLARPAGVGRPGGGMAGSVAPGAGRRGAARRTPDRGEAGRVSARGSPAASGAVGAACGSSGPAYVPVEW